MKWIPWFSRVSSVLIYLKVKHCSGNLGGPTQGILFCWFYILRKILETCVSMTFPDFQRRVEWCQSYFRKMFPKAFRKLGYYATQGYLMCNNFCAPYYTLKFQCDFTVSAKPVWPNMTSKTLYVKSLPTPRGVDSTKIWGVQKFGRGYKNFFGGAKCLILGEKRYFVWDTASKSTKWLFGGHMAPLSPLATPVPTPWLDMKKQRI